MVRPLIGLCSRAAAGICCQQWHSGVQGLSSRAKGRERCSKWGHIFSLQTWGQGLGHSLQLAGNIQLLAQEESREWRMTHSTALPPHQWQVLGSRFQGGREGQRHSSSTPVFSTDSLLAHLDRAENNSMQKEGQEVPEFGWGRHWAWCGLLWHGSKSVWGLGKDTHYLHSS